MLCLVQYHGHVCSAGTTSHTSARQTDTRAFLRHMQVPASICIGLILLLFLFRYETFTLQIAIARLQHCYLCHLETTSGDDMGKTCSTVGRADLSGKPCRFKEYPVIVILLCPGTRVLRFLMSVSRLCAGHCWEVLIMLCCSSVRC